MAFPIMSSRLLCFGAVIALTSLTACSTLERVSDSIFGSGSDKRVPGQRVALMARNNDVLVQDPAYAGMGVTVPGPTRVSAWAQPGGVSENVVGNTDAPVSFNKLWSTDIGVSTSSTSAITASPVVADGLIFTLDAAANVRAIDTASGGEVWTVSVAPEDTSYDFYLFSRGGDRPEEGYGGGIAYENGRLFVTSGFGEVVALDSRSGGRIWSKKVESPFHTAPTVRDGRVYVMNRENRAWALDAATGGELWSHEVFSESAGVLASSSPAVSSDIVVVPYTNGDLYAMRTINGRPAWSDSLTRTGLGDTLSSINDIAGRPAIDGTTVFAVGNAGRLVAINAATGGRLWQRDIAGVQTPVAAGDYLYAMSIDGNLYCLEKVSGRIAWKTYLGRWEDEEDRTGTVDWSGPLMAQGNLILVSTDGRVAIVAANNGGLVQSFDVGEGSIIAPITAGGTLYMLNDDGVLTAYR